ncbi:leucine-rich repeat domain-containing protein [Candidatus Halobeggiatoa sp. HSG11]|nr:leucine-rich repeat domain-containing protein [Candidatus Halobeggiatoa sp. HSG11]
MIRFSNVQNVLVRQCYSPLLILSIVLGSLWLPSVQAATDCTAITGIPQVECEALVALYNNTDGPNWDDSSTNDWNVTDTPCSWKGVICSDEGNVVWIDRFLMELVGTIPSELGNLTELKQLRLSNNQLSGSIPSELGNLTQLTDLYLSGNQLSGSIPSELGNLVQLHNLGLSNNKLTGSIPSELGNLTELTGLYLSNNLLDGSIPSELGNLTQLTGFYLYNNQLTGEIPVSLSNLTKLFKNSEDATDTVNGLNISNNQLTTSNEELINFLNNKDPDWNGTPDGDDTTSPDGDDTTTPDGDDTTTPDGDDTTTPDGDDTTTPDGDDTTTPDGDDTTTPDGDDTTTPDGDDTTTPDDDDTASQSDSMSQVGFSRCSGPIISGLCNNGGVLKDVTFTTSANVAGGKLAGTITNKGVLSNFANKTDALVDGGKLTGYIENDGTLANFEFVGASIIGGTLSGTIYNNSEVGGFFKDVTLAVGTHIIGGTLTGDIQGDCENPAKLQNITINSGSDLSCVIVDSSERKNLTGVNFGQGVQFADLTSLGENTDTELPATGDGTTDETTDGELPATDDGTAGETTDDGTAGETTDGELPATDDGTTDETTDGELPATDDGTTDETTDGELPATGEEVNLPSLNTAININNLGETVISKASFGYGIAVNDGSFEQNIVLASSDNMDIRGRIEVEVAHVGQMIDIAVVIARVSDDNALHYFMLDSYGDFIPWDEDMKSLLSIQTVEAPATPLDVQIYSGQLDNIGISNFYIGYRLVDGTVVYSIDTLEVTITE